MSDLEYFSSPSQVIFIPVPSLSSFLVTFTSTSLQSHALKSYPKSCCHPELFHIWCHKFRHFFLIIMSYLFNLLTQVTPYKSDLKPHWITSPYSLTLFSSVLFHLHPSLYIAEILPVHCIPVLSIPSPYYTSITFTWPMSNPLLVLFSEFSVIMGKKH